jgi:hypothetical protein
LVHYKNIFSAGSSSFYRHLHKIYQEKSSAHDLMPMEHMAEIAPPAPKNFILRACSESSCAQKQNHGQKKKKKKKKTLTCPVPGFPHTPFPQFSMLHRTQASHPDPHRPPMSLIPQLGRLAGPPASLMPPTTQASLDARAAHHSLAPPVAP